MIKLAHPHPAAVLSYLLLAVAVPMAVTGCSVHVDKRQNGQGKKIAFETPLGGIHINTNNAATQTGIDAYPGATSAVNFAGHNAADVQAGFGAWKLHVQVARYATPDSRAKVVAFYRQALAKYGDVLECQGYQPMGRPLQTAEGLSCGAADRSVHVEEDPAAFSLRTGSRRRQHVVAFEPADSSAEPGPTRFKLMALDLPDERWNFDHRKQDGESD